MNKVNDLCTGLCGRCRVCSDAVGPGLSELAQLALYGSQLAVQGLGVHLGRLGRCQLCLGLLFLGHEMVVVRVDLGDVVRSAHTRILDRCSVSGLSYGGPHCCQMKSISCSVSGLSHGGPQCCQKNSISCWLPGEAELRS